MLTALRNLSFLFCGILSVPSALGAPVHVEVIVFAHDDTNAGYEWFMKPEAVIKVEELIDEDITLSEPASADQSNLVDKSLNNIAVTGPQPVEAYVLTKFAKAIEDNPNFELLNYVSWVQEPVPKSRTQSISLDLPLDDSIFSSELLLSGATSVYEIAQLLQFDINVAYKPDADIEQETVYLPQAVSRYEPTVVYRLDERRQVQIDDIHYFDHPKFGVVFTIIRPKQPEVFIQ